MKAVEYLLAVLVVALAGFVGAQSSEAGEGRFLDQASGQFEAPQKSLDGTGDSTALRQSASGALPREIWNAADSSLDNGDGNSGDEHGDALPLNEKRLAALGRLREKIVAAETGTYFAELLAARDSALARWPSRITNPLRVWVDEPADNFAWHPDFPNSVRDAFDTWSATGVPVRFTFVRDSATADVHVVFTRQLADAVSGRTVWTRDSHWWLVSGNIELALTHPQGSAVTPAQMRAITLHEVGHLLGLDHSSAANNIMSSRVRVRDITEADRATVRLLYALPAGSLK